MGRRGWEGGVGGGLLGMGGVDGGGLNEGEGRLGEGRGMGWRGGGTGAGWHGWDGVWLRGIAGRVAAAMKC